MIQPFNAHPTCLACIAFLTLSCLSTTMSPQEKTEVFDSKIISRAQNAEATYNSDENLKETSIQVAVDPNKIALIIAISEYDSETGWDKIASTNDIPLIKASLAAQGFDTVNNVAVLQDQQASRTGITQAIQQHLLKKAQPGSIAVLHYSGHGQQVFDDNGEELDGFDEALVPYDAPQKVEGPNSDYKGEKHLRDDELGLLLRQLRQKIGPSGDLIVVLDACHSGTATRGELTHVRGTNTKIAPPGYQPSQSRGKNEGWDEAGEGNQLSPIVVISGAGANQLNYEARDKNGNRVGSLSYALSRTLSKAEAHTSYRGLFDMIMVDMSSLAPRQTPQIEGDLDRQILGGQAVPQLDYYTVKEHYDDKNITIKGGQLYGIYEDTEVALYDIDTQDTTGVTPKASGRVIASYLQESDVLLDQGVSQSEAENSWVFITSKNFGAMQVKVKLDIRENEAFTNALRKEFAEAPLIKETAENPELLIEMNTEFTKEQGVNALQIITAHDYVVYENVVQEARTPAIAEDVTEKIISYAQASFLRNLEMEAEDIRVSFEVIPIEAEQQGRRVVETRSLPIENKMNKEGMLVLNEGDYIKLRIINHGIKKAYFALLDIQPDNVINALIPNNGRTAEEYVVAAGDTLIPNDIFQIGRPFGTENFKLIATTEPFEIGPIVTTRGESTGRGGNLTPLEKLFRDTYKTKRMKNRGASTPSVSPSSGHIETLVFRIEEGK
ncbi:caspase family protein [Catalinimonas sp. 4WD22]|uniref:caspase family protein n=1 Tax=Catalinimonas locisalis TaxID=3133978 RepID=UPI0031013AC5